MKHDFRYHKTWFFVPLLLSYGGIEEGVKKRLEGLTYKMPVKACSDERLVKWILLSVGSTGR